MGATLWNNLSFELRDSTSRFFLKRKSIQSRNKTKKTLAGNRHMNVGNLRKSYTALLKLLRLCYKTMFIIVLYLFILLYLEVASRI